MLIGKTKASLIGGIAIAMWAVLALLTAWSGQVPPFQLVAMAFSVAFLLAAGKWFFLGQDPRPFLRMPALAWLVGVGGLFGYHLFYFLALRNAPVVEASLIAYLWPLLIVLFSALLPGERLRPHHMLGAAIGFAGAYLLTAKGAVPAFEPGYVWGYTAAAVCALTWSSYSVLSRRLAALPTDTVGIFCGATALLSGAAHLAFEETVWPANIGQWLAVLGLGLGPVGAAFFLWDVGVKRGHIQLLGVASYLAPLFSTLILVIAGLATASWHLLGACLLITLGAFVAAADLILKRHPDDRGANGG